MFQALPDFLAETKYRNPTSTASPAQKVLGITDTFFGHVTRESKMAERVTKIQSIMSAQTSSHWLDVFPMAQELAIWDPNPDQVLFVDLGGGMFEGQQCQNLRKKYPHLKGRVVLQDLQEVLDSVRPMEGIEFMAQDFFTPQSIHGMFSAAAKQKSKR
jgi:demethylsterigmatocystin 6-O-methyltransferase